MPQPVVRTPAAFTRRRRFAFPLDPSTHTGAQHLDVCTHPRANATVASHQAMSRRVCAQPGCPTLVATGRCAAHQRAADKARGTRTERGYGPDHVQARQDWQERIDTGEHVTCWRCTAPITGTAWHLGHDDHDRSITRGPECITCNLRAAGAKTAGR